MNVWHNNYGSRSAGGTRRWFIMHRVGIRSAQSAALPYDHDGGELIVIVEETGFLFWTWAGNSSDYLRVVAGVGDVRAGPLCGGSASVNWDELRGGLN